MTPIQSMTGMLLDGVFASEAIDGDGEVVKIDGMDISSLEAGEGTVNYEHRNEDDGGCGQETVGRIVYAKKIFKESDCETDRQLEYFKKVNKIPYLYGIVRLFDAAGHAGAQALAAAIRDMVANREPICLRYSIEGSRLSRDPKNKYIVTESVARRVALTWKPANKTAFLGLVSDPAAPQGWGEPKSIAKGEHSDLSNAPIGGAVSVVCIDPVVPDSLAKTLTAGNTDVAPSSLTGGSALQREDKQIAGKIVKLIASRKKPYRRVDFLSLLRAECPELTDDAINKVADLAEAADLAKEYQGSLLGETEQRGRIKAPSSESRKTPQTIENLTWRGRKIRTLRNPQDTRFDAAKGILHTPKGNLKAYLPHHDGAESERRYREILSHPHIEKAMDVATSNWARAHRLLKDGKLPEEVVMHSVIFSQLSPNKPVPIQELQYARLIDAMRETGLDPRKPGFERIEPRFRELDSPTEVPRHAEHEFRTNPVYYIGGRIGVQRDLLGNPVGDPAQYTGRYPGHLRSASPLMQDFFKRASQYHAVHDVLMDVVRRYRHDGIGAVKELMDSKRQKLLHDNRRRAILEREGRDIGEFDGLSIPGLKVKTGLYTWGMMGGGNSFVPDTHFLRHLFGLHIKHDAKTIEYVKGLYWDPKNYSSLIKPTNEWYMRNHPAVEYTLKHPVHGKHFDREEDALFTSFWRHWLTIQPHEKFLGMPNLSEQESTTHVPFWEAIKPFVKAEKPDFDDSLPMKTAVMHAKYVRELGETPGLFLYFHHLLPLLLDAGEARRKQQEVLSLDSKASNIEKSLVELRKSVHNALSGEMDGTPKVYRISVIVNGKPHPAGRYAIVDGHLHHLEDYHGLLDRYLPEGLVDDEAMVRIHGLQWSPRYQVEAHDVNASNDSQAGKNAVSKDTQESTNQEQAKDGLQNEKMPQMTISESPTPRPPSTFEYLRAGHTHPHIVSFGPHGAEMDGNKLTPDELALILDNVERGVATLRYCRSARNKGIVDDFKKSEEDEPSPLSRAIAWIRSEVAAGRADPAHERALTQHIYEDSMVPGIGNKFAYSEFRKQNRPGVYVSADANSFKHINDTYGHEAGDHAITHIGNALKHASEMVGTGKLFRPGGDEFVAHFPTHEEAAKFVHHATNYLDSLPHIHGVHKLSMSFGLGTDFASADRALYHAKAGKKSVHGTPLYEPHNTPHLAHSLVPGFEGSIPIHHQPLPQAPSAVHQQAVAH